MENLYPCTMLANALDGCLRSGLQADTRLRDFILQVESLEFGSPYELLTERAELLRRAGQPAKAQEVFLSDRCDTLVVAWE